MTSLNYGLEMPYEVQLEHTSDPSNNHMVILAAQRSPGQLATRHLLTPGVYMVSLAYNGAAGATLHHVDGGTAINRVSVPAGTAGSPRTSAPMKISVQGTAEYLQVAAPGTGGSARATISVIPTTTFDEMAESAEGVSVLSEIDTLKSTKADKSTLDARVPADMSLRLDTTVGNRIFAGDTMIHGDTGWRILVSWDTTGTVTYGTMPTGMGPVSGMAGGLWIRRVQERVTLSISGASGLSSSGMVDVPSGFHQESSPYPTAPFRVSSGTGWASIGSGKIYLSGSAGNNIPSNSSAPYSATITWDVFGKWPTSLPGKPA